MTRRMRDRMRDRRATSGRRRFVPVVLALVVAAAVAALASEYADDNPTGTEKMVMDRGGESLPRHADGRSHSHGHAAGHPSQANHGDEEGGGHDDGWVNGWARGVLGAAGAFALGSGVLWLMHRAHPRRS